MNPDNFILSRNIHSTASNSLLRLCDLADRIVSYRKEMFRGERHSGHAEAREWLQTTLNSNRKAG